jgi:ribosomal protein S18 acetylase RimI-like enzyme
VGLYDVFTAPAARGKGYARVLCQHLLAQARSRGARHAYLQVESDNEAARAVYHRLGFADGYAYHYRTRDPSAA